MIITLFISIIQKQKGGRERMENVLKTIGSWLFLVGILVAVIVGLVTEWVWPASESAPAYITLLLAVLGFIVGILSFLAVGTITQERVPTFLIAALMLLGIGASGTLFKDLDLVGVYFQNIAAMLAVFVAPAAGLLAIRAIWDTGKSKEIEKVLPKIPLK